MSNFNLYLQLGFQHIADLRGYDHILFLLTLVAVYSFSEWKKVIVLVTAFTIGHSTTLALATLNILNIPSNLIEFLIPLTIFITAVANISVKTQGFSKSLHHIKYLTAMFFGLIHGLGFSNYLRALLGSEISIVKPLFAFNIGLELGQIFIVIVILSFAWIAVKGFSVKQREWNLVLSGAGIGVSIILMIERGAILF